MRKEVNKGELIRGEGANKKLIRRVNKKMVRS